MEEQKDPPLSTQQKLLYFFIGLATYGGMHIAFEPKPIKYEQAQTQVSSEIVKEWQTPQCPYSRRNK